jgi:hypothetical protein
LAAEEKGRKRWGSLHRAIMDKEEASATNAPDANPSDKPGNKFFRNVEQR